MRDEAEVKREALEEFADWLVNVMGFDGTANLAREQSAKLYPPPPKRVRAQVDVGYGMVATFSSTSIDLSYRGDFRCTIAREAAVKIAEMNARADEDGMLLEGEAEGLDARTPAKTEARDKGAGIAGLDTPRHDATPALGTKGNPVTREQVLVACEAYWQDDVSRRERYAHRVEMMARALRAIGLEVQS